MRSNGTPRLSAAVAAAVVLAVLAPTGAAADPTPAPGAPVCQIRDDRLTEISGLVATDDGYVVVNDGADDEARRRIFFLDADCAVTRALRYPSRPRDTEDLAVGADGTIWVADVGDNDRSRQTVAVWKLAPGAARPVLYRMAYPDRPHDAEAMLVTGDGRPVIVSKYSGVLYAPSTALRAGATVPLAQVGQVRLPASTTSNPFSVLGRTAVTGAATAPGGDRVVLRTYADAFEFDVTGGDVIAALTSDTPRVTPLPDEPQGESITYSRDGRSLLTVSETADQPAGTRPSILRYPVAAPSPVAPSPAATAAPPTTSAPGGRVAGDRADRADRGGTPMVAAGAVGFGLLVAGLLVLVRWRRSRPDRPR
ncbi:esterase-like activity of phytase family protein [Micromonospora sp. S4605]|uniref:esterase-like activity of phytase family protein n=1 Tax=Micromonospora sp. S4605 TaxID=1420897 RepID=UPI001E5392C7|nr:esterase-like activity of phytase family protein [Micromonospora sp. S4605]